MALTATGASSKTMQQSANLEQILASQLRDIHIPDAVSAWPPAPGWWILVISSLILITTTLYLLWRSGQRNRYRRLAVKQLAALKPLHQNPASYLQQLNYLLKQTAIAETNQSGVAGLTGNQWLEYLDRGIDGNQFSQGIGKVLLTGPYAIDAPSVDIVKLETLCHHWIKKHQRAVGNSTPC